GEGRSLQRSHGASPCVGRRVRKSEDACFPWVAWHAFVAFLVHASPWCRRATRAWHPEFGLGGIGNRRGRLDLDALVTLIESQPPSHVLGGKQRCPIDFIPRGGWTRQEERKVPLVLPGTVANPHMARDARLGTIQEVPLRDEAVAPQMPEI